MGLGPNNSTGRVLGSLVEALRRAVHEVAAEVPLITEGDFDCAESLADYLRKLADDLESACIEHANGRCAGH